MSAADNALMLLVPCHRCGQLDGNWCVTKTGKRAASLHGTRYWDTQEARILYWIEQEEAVERAAREIGSAQDHFTVAHRIINSARQMIASLKERLEVAA